MKEMDALTGLVKQEIKKQYKSVRRFSMVCDIPYSTLANALTKGISCTAYGTVNMILDLLGISRYMTEDANVIYANRTLKGIGEKLITLDDRGLHTVETILQMEYDRCQKEGKEKNKYGRDENAHK